MFGSLRAASPCCLLFLPQRAASSPAAAFLAFLALPQYGADLNAKTPKNWTPLSYARAKGKYGLCHEKGVYPEDVLKVPPSSIFVARPRSSSPPAPRPPPLLTAHARPALPPRSITVPMCTGAPRRGPATAGAPASSTAARAATAAAARGTERPTTEVALRAAAWR